MAIEIKYILSLTCLLQIFTQLNAIRVDWGTNTGPIRPPTSTERPLPVPPFRAPAPVWEDQSNDIPNPNQYKYVLPPTSRPRYNDITPDHKYAQSQPIPATQQSKIISQPTYNTNNVVPSLAVQYVPNKGMKYYAVVPDNKSAYLKTNEIETKYDKYDKLNGKYNAKLKKYKAYEKAKFVPYYMYFSVPKQQYFYSSIPPKAVVNNQ